MRVEHSDVPLMYGEIITFIDELHTGVRVLVLWDNGLADWRDRREIREVTEGEGVEVR